MRGSVFGASILLQLLGIGSLAWSTPTPNTNNQVLLISFDGFRWDYFEKVALPHFQRIIDNGVKASWLKSVFPSKTFPSHVSMSTGLHPEQHGIVENYFYDKKLQEYFSLSTGSADPKWWQAGEPIWITTTKNNILSGASFWPGNAVSYAGITPAKNAIFQKDFPVKQRIDEVVNWLVNGVRFVAMYVEYPDEEGHEFGPESAEVVKALKRVDGYLGYLLNKLANHSLTSNLDIVIVSDHGMQTVLQSKYLADANPTQLDISLVRQVTAESTMLSFELPSNLAANMEQSFLKNLSVFLGANYTTYNSIASLPDRWFYKGWPDRIATYNVLGKPGSTVAFNRSKSSDKKGVHGYDNAEPSMRGIFLAMGKSFLKTPRSTEAMEAVDVYGVVLKLLQLDNVSVKSGSRDRIRRAVSSGLLISKPANLFYLFLPTLLLCSLLGM